MDPRVNEKDEWETGDTVRFYISSADSLDNFSAHALRLWGREFPTAEHAFQWKKFFTAYPDIADEILSARSPAVAKQIARTHKTKQPTSWQAEKVAVMEEILRAKVAQHEDVREVLRRLEDRVLVEYSLTDDFWGSGLEGKGKNMMGHLWMRIRDTLG